MAIAVFGALANDRISTESDQLADNATRLLSRYILIGREINKRDSFLIN